MAHVMVDIETLGAAGNVVLSIAAVRFDDDGLGQEFYRSLDIWDQLMLGLNVDPETLVWWRGQVAEAQTAAQPPNGRVRLHDGLTALAKFIKHGDRVWAKGPDYDLVSLSALYRKADKSQPWRYKDARDVRTIYAVSGAKENKSPLDHSALEDAREQARAVIVAYRNLGRSLADDQGE